MKSFIVAVQFLTRFTISTKIGSGEKELGESMIYFPLVGVLLGSFLVLINTIGGNFLPMLVVDSLVLVTLIVLTGAIHLDGFTDTIDGLAGGRSKEETLEIMRDSRVGVIGVVAVFCLLLTKLSLIHEMPGYLKNSSLILMPVIGRWAMVMGASSSSYARSGAGLGQPFIDYVGLKEFAIATIITVLIGWGLMSIKGIILILAVYPVVLLLISFIKKKIDGLTGDTLGGIGEVVEVVALLIIVCLGGLESAHKVKFL